MLLEKTFAWAREVNPSQPLTAGTAGSALILLGQADTI
jgi:hypothetical protein